MAEKGLSLKDKILLLVFVLLLGGLCYYLFFWQPLQRDVAALQAQAQGVDEQIQVAAAREEKLTQMKAELQAIADSGAEASEVAPFDNSKAVMAELGAALANSTGYEISFADPAADDGGMVRRSVSMSFTCADFAAARGILQTMANGPWRCLVTDLAFTAAAQSPAADGAADSGAAAAGTAAADPMQGAVAVQATIIYFESAASADTSGS